MTGSEPLQRTLRALREQLALAMDAWNKFCTGTAMALPQFHDYIKEIAARIVGLQHQDISRLGRIILGTVEALRRTPAAHSETLALEIATALLLLDNALEHAQSLDSAFTEQVAAVGNRINAAFQGQPLAEMPRLDEVSQQAQEKLLLGHVVKELQVNLSMIEQVLDAFFRNRARGDELTALIKPIRQTEGALSVLGQKRAAEIVRECEKTVAGFITAPKNYGQADFEALASKFSALGFFIEDLQRGSADIDRYLRPQVVAPATDHALGPTTEAELEQARHQTKALAGALHEQPEDATLRGEIRQKLEVVRDNAKLVEDAALAEQASAAINVLESEQPVADLASAIAQLAPPAAPVAQPSPEAARLATASMEEIDAELLDIFIEEAQEVLTTVETQLAQLVTHPHGRETLTTVRRSFHTLKGSGRMVGLSELGETAWAVEQVLNRWLELEREASPALLARLQNALKLFRDWARQLGSGGGSHRDATALVAACAVLKAEVEGTPVLSSAPVAESVPAAVPVSSPDQEISIAAMPEPEESIAIEPIIEPGLQIELEPLPELQTEPELRIELKPLPELQTEPELRVELEPLPEPQTESELRIELEPLPEPQIAPELITPSSVAPVQPPSSVTPAPVPAPQKSSGIPTLTLVPPAPTPPSNDIQIGGLTLSPGLYALYIHEANDYIATLQSELSTDGAPRRAMIRAAHTLAGISATTGIAPVRSLAHALEVALNRLAVADVKPAEEQKLLLARATGALEGMVGAIAAQRFPETEDVLTAELNSLGSESSVTTEKVSAGTEKKNLSSLTNIAAEAHQSVPTPQPLTDGEHPAGVATEIHQLALVDQLDEELLPIFLEDSTDLMHGIGTDLRAWREQPDSIEITQQIKRTLHTLKGSARMAGAMRIGELAHDMETRVAQADAIQALTPDFWDALDGSFDRISMLMDRLRENGMVADVPEVPVSPENIITEAHQPVPVDQLDEDLLPIFLEESTDLMRSIGAGLRAWRGQPDSVQVIQQLKRTLHTLKGSARMAGAMRIGELVHDMETRVAQLEATQAPAPDFLDALDGSFDRISLFMDRLRENGVAADVPETPIPEAPVPDALPQPVRSESTEEINIPPPEVKTDPVVSSPVQVTAPPATAAQVRSGFHDSEASVGNVLRVRADIVDKLVNEAGEIAITRGRVEGEMRSIKGSLLELTEDVIRLRNQLREIEIQSELQMQSRQALSTEKDADFDPLEFDRFTRFQELTRSMAESVNDITTSQHSLLQNLDQVGAALTAQARLNREHAQALMSVRTVPFNTLDDRLYRIARQTANALNKRVNLDLKGGQTELDRSVLEKMTGPIEHLLRNAIAHGIETPEERRATNKPETGEIVLRVAQEGNEIAVELTDDGRGLAYERIKARALAAGLIPADQPVSIKQLNDLVLQAGFSTADTVSSISGRGVGLDVVRSQVTNLGGRVHIESTPGHGSSFLIHLPLTLAVTQAVLVRSGMRHFAIPSTMVAQVHEMRPEAIATVRKEGFTSWRNEIYPWHYLPHLLGQHEVQPELAHRHWLLLLKTGDQRVAIEVDRLFSSQEFVVKNIGAQLARIVGIDGATVLGDGKIALILNPLALAERASQAVSAAVPAAVTVPAPAAPAVPIQEAAPAAQHTGMVMVVDDSLTVRKITSRLLTREGYHVITAKDGIDALEKLTDMMPDVMLVDIEMPRMDGFNLTKNVRANERLKAVPIIMITSRIADKHRNYAQEIGVDHYMGKPYDEAGLLKLIAGYTGRTA
jgi:chemosensory pili system protein ChpA (sensor histidine kinase/response regulator)